MKKKIAVIGLKGLPAFGGAAVVGENLVEQLKNDYDFTILSVSSHTSPDKILFDGYKQIVFRKFSKGSLNTLVYTLKCLLHCLTHKYDLIHIHHASTGFITPFLRIRNKLIVTFHGVHHYDDPKFSRIHNWFFRLSERLNIKFANKVISVSKPNADFIEAKYKRSILYIPNGISTNIATYGQLSQSKKGNYILFAAARIYDIKGLHLLLKALKKLNLDVELKIAGSLDQTDKYKKEIMELAVSMNIEFLGLIKDKNKLFSLVSQARFFVFPSLHEAMSMMLLEVAALKTPIVASDIESNKAVFDETEVVFFRNNDVEDLTNKINFALTNEEELTKRMEKAYNKLAKDYTWNKIAKQYNDLIVKLLA
ncbi:MAG: glycosyltransferase family 4 protein [Bacteroidota bacterium]